MRAVHLHRHHPISRPGVRRIERDHVYVEPRDPDDLIIVQEPPPPTAPLTLTRFLTILGNDRVVVPGCEATSDITSLILNRELRKYCKHVTVDLQDALNAIPGSDIIYGTNFGIDPNVRQKWFALPPLTLDCCDAGTDWYSILRNLESKEEEEETFGCVTVDMGYCPSPEFALIPPPPTDTYVPERTDILHEHYT